MKEASKLKTVIELEIGQFDKQTAKFLIKIHKKQEPSQFETAILNSEVTRCRPGSGGNAPQI